MKFLFFIFIFTFAFTQERFDEQELLPTKTNERIEIKPTALDSEIQTRLQNILNATDWFRDGKVEVREGVVFLTGVTSSDEYKKWAGNLAKNTENVVAVVNKIEVREEFSIKDFGSTAAVLQKQWRRFIRSLPSVMIGIFILLVTWGLAYLGAKITRSVLPRRLRKSLLKDVIARFVAVLIFLVGIYLIFEIADLTGAALTVISGTGILGIILGIAFRDITENFLSSILLSIHHPFKNGDLVEITGYTGYVQRLTMRVTVLMSVDGNHIQIPNAVVYKSNIRNFTSNPHRRESFDVGIGTENSIAEAQKIALDVLEKHEAVLKEPEPQVLVENLGNMSVNLRVFFWVDGNKHSWMKVKSSLMRQINRVFLLEKISMPDSREVLFPKTLSVHMVEHDQAPKKQKHDEVVNESKTELRSDAEDIKELAKQARNPEGGKNFLPPEK